MDFSDLMALANESIDVLAPPLHYLQRQAPRELNNGEGAGTNFQDSMVDELLPSSKEIGSRNSDSGKHILLEGLASAGKTTEMRRLAYSLRSKLTNPHLRGYSNRVVVHLFSMQNYDGIGANISTTADLWNLLHSCHEARSIAGEALTLDEFCELHRENNHQSILLIDTLDMLAYGRDDESRDAVTSVWADLVREMTKKGLTVFWSVRPNEIDPEKRLDSELGLTRIQLPMLQWDGCHRAARQFIRTTKPQNQKLDNDFYTFVGLLVRQYPIMSRYLHATGRIELLRTPLFETLVKLYTRFAESRGYEQHVHPLKWVMEPEYLPRTNEMVAKESLLSNVVLDELYKLSRLEILNALVNILHIPKEVVEDLWHEMIEIRLFDQVDDQQADFTNRLWIPRVLEDDYGDTNALYEFLILTGSVDYDGYGLFTQTGNRVSFNHQLFAEYAVYRAALSLQPDSFKDTVAKHIPSCRLRMLAFSNFDEDSQVEMFLDWFGPFFTINRQLQNIEDHAPQLLNTEAWEKARSYAIQYKKHKNATTTSVIQASLGLSENQRKQISEDKVNILAKHADSSEPLVINGPAGTGKSYIANPFIASFISRTRSSGEWVDGDRPLVKFLTLSPDLAANFIKEHEKYMGYQFLSEDEQLVHPAAITVDELLHQLTNIVSQNPMEFDDYLQLLLNETTFIEVLSRDFTLNRDLPNRSLQSLWHEYLECVLDEKGNGRSQEDYEKSPIRGKRESQFEDRGARSKFYQAMVRNGFLNPSRYKTRRKFANDVIEHFENVFVVENDVHAENQLLDRIKEHQSSVLIIDEVQDLGSAVLKLCFMLHKGKQRDVAILGDREQTLELREFDWSHEFKEIGSALYKLAESIQQSGRTDHLGLQKWAHITGGADLSNTVKDRINEFSEVHRNVPPIVELMRWSFKNSVPTRNFENEIPGPENGTASIHSSRQREEEYEEWKQRYEEGNQALAGKLPKGVFFIGDHTTGTPYKLSIDELLDLIETVSLLEDPIEIILPDDAHREMVASQLKQKDIQQTVWDPISIKGLENDTIIAISPWSIHTERIKRISPRLQKADGQTMDWDNIGSFVTHRIRGDFIDIVKQRRRHANVMLSRPRDTLFILTLDTQQEHVDLFDTTKPNLVEILGGPEKANISEEISSLEELKQRLGVDENTENLKDPKRHMMFLEKLIQQSRGLDQIGIKSKQIYNIAAAKMQTEPKKYQFVFYKFQALHDFAIKSQSGAELLEKVLFSPEFRSHNLEYYTPEKEEKLTDLQSAFRSWQDTFHQVSKQFEVKFEDENLVLSYGSIAYDNMVKEFNKFVKEFSGFGDLNDYMPFVGIEAFVEKRIFGGEVDVGKSTIWFERARKMKLRKLEMHHALQLNERSAERIDQLLDLMAMFHRSYYTNIGRNATEAQLKELHQQMLTQRGYSEQDAKKDRANKLCPYSKTEPPTESDQSLVGEGSHGAFWKDGLGFLEYNEFSEKQIEELAEKFFEELSEIKEPAEDADWVDVQLQWFVKLVLHDLERAHPDSGDIEESLLRLLDIERYGSHRDLGSKAFSIDTPQTRILSRHVYEELSTFSGVPEPQYSDILGRNHFSLYNLINHHLKEKYPLNSQSPQINVERFYGLLQFVYSLDSREPFEESVWKDLEEKLGQVMEFMVHNHHFLNGIAIHTNLQTIFQTFTRAPSQGLLIGQFSRDLANLDQGYKMRILQHVLHAYMDSHKTRTFADTSLRWIFGSSSRQAAPMGLVPDVSVKKYILNELNCSKVEFGQLINSLFPIHSTQERTDEFGDPVPYFEVHVNARYMDTPTKLFDFDGSRPTELKNRRLSWLAESLGFAFEEGLCDLQHVERNAIYSLGLKGFSEIVLYLPKAPSRFANFEEIWSRKEELAAHQIHQQYIRHYLGQSIDDLDYINSNYAELDQSHPNAPRIYLGTLSGIGLQLPMDRYLQVERFSRFIRAHLMDLPVFEGRELHQRELAKIDEIFKVNSLLKTLFNEWVNSGAEAWRGLDSIVSLFWNRLSKSFSDSTGIDIPSELSSLFANTHCDYVFQQIIGTAAGEGGLYGAIRKILADFSGTRADRNEIKAYNRGQVAPGSGSLPNDIGRRDVPQQTQQTVLSQIDYMNWSAESRKPISELHRLSYAGSIVWFEGFTPSDIRRPSAE